MIQYLLLLVPDARGHGHGWELICLDLSMLELVFFRFGKIFHDFSTHVLYLLGRALGGERREKERKDRISAELVWDGVCPDICPSDR